MDIVILLPTYNEEQSIGRIIDEIRSFSSDWRLVVADSGSSDRTVAIAKEKNANVIQLGERGKGRAIKNAFGNITADRIIIMDSDLTYPPAEIPKFLEMLNKCDIVVGARFKGSIEPKAMSSINKFGNFCLTAAANFLYGKNLSDVCSGMWGFTKKAYTTIAIDAPHFELEANFFVESTRKKLVLCEIPISYRKRAGKTKLNISHGFKIAWYFISHRL